ncbi:tRNA (adenosine(37)-N6)-threonylcarbamoyltransferase complex dimerization subunit type 1 TsaB [Candidatus Saccharibacteria bacterium]|nr:tRNA (adenosine(37)-N6)-threonylcarbamoyltransferase complex dimerization subunit type 1 TsaB [Candidatus Saccharibacteria bacterium]
MKLVLDTSTPTTKLTLGDQHYVWESGRNLARDLLAYIHERLKEQGKDWHDLTEIHYNTGPGSFTGLRIGATVVNTLATELNIPLYDQSGKKLTVALPVYDRPAHTTPPRK